MDSCFLAQTKAYYPERGCYARPDHEKAFGELKKETVLEYDTQKYDFKAVVQRMLEVDDSTISTLRLRSSSAGAMIPGIRQRGRQSAWAAAIP